MGRFGKHSHCYACHSKQAKAAYHADLEGNRKRKRMGSRKRRGGTSVVTMLGHAKTRAKAKGVPYQLSEEDISIPEVCPVFGTKLAKGPARGRKSGPSDNSPSLDRIVPSLGYVVGNVIVVSWLANRIKSNATPDQIIAVGQFYKRLLQTRSA